jgi:hypothetical protein
MIPTGCHMAMDKTKVTTPLLPKGGSSSSTEMSSEVQIPNSSSIDLNISHQINPN